MPRLPQRVFRHESRFRAWRALRPMPRRGILVVQQGRSVEMQHWRQSRRSRFPRFPSCADCVWHGRALSLIRHRSDGFGERPSLKNLGNCIMIRRLMRVRVLFQFDANDGEWFEAVDDIRSHSGRLLDGPKIICRGQAPRPVSSFTPTRSIDSASTYRAMLCPQSRKETRRTQIIQKLKVTTFHVKVAE